jgi:hypothetical protein
MGFAVGRMLDQIKDGLPFLRRALSRSLKASFVRTMFDNYHPEQHYMRGSGPKSRLKASDQDAASKQA